MQISFIVIGRNESWRLSQCLESIQDLVVFNKIKNYEVIYVDSNSNDDSIKRAKTFPSLKVYSITGKYNAAIARNIGFEQSTGDILFFIDGDMKIRSDFWKSVIELQLSTKEVYLTGQVIDIIYDKKWNKVGESLHYKKNTNPLKVNATGGVFVISRYLWNLAGGMKTKYKRSQDLDLSLRLSKKGYRITRYPNIICEHFTIPHSESHRMWSNILNLNVFYNTSLLFREHIFNKYYILQFYRSNYSMLLLILTIFLSLFFSQFFGLIIYLVLIILRSYSNTMAEKKGLFYFLSRVAYHLVKDIVSIIMILFFFPKSHKLTYKRVQ